MRRITAYDLFSYFGARGLLNWIPDNEYLKIQYYLKLHRKLHLDTPKTMNEKLQWLKIHDRNPVYSELVDKYKVRSHIEKIVGKEVLLPLLGVWDKPEDICFKKLPNQFVLKSNHDSGGVVLCKDKTSLDFRAVIKKLNRKMHRNYYWGNREWPYKNVQRLVLAEEYIQDNYEESTLTDYKFYCFNGKPDFVLACVDRKPGYANFIFFDRNWNKMNYNFQTDEEEKRIVPKPINLEIMFEMAEKIAKYVNSPFLRVDLYNSQGKVYFGEITFYPHSGMDGTIKTEIDNMLGEKIKLPIV